MNRRISGLFASAIISAARTAPTNSFVIQRSIRLSAVSAAYTYRTAQVAHFSKGKTLLYAEVPEPGPCPKCSDDNGYWDGSANFVCIACGHEWLVKSADADADADDGADDNGADDDGANDGIVRDSNGTVLETGDTVVLIKELGKGLKKGLKVTRIRIGYFGDDHDVQASIPGLGTFNLKSQFLKKSGK